MTDFEVEVRASGGDYTSIVTAESALDENITAATTKVFSFDANSGTIPDGTAVTTDGGSTTGTVIHQSVNGQILIKSIDGGTFDDNDVVTDGTNTVTLSNGGDASNIIMTVYNTQTISAYTDLAGAVCNSTNKFVIQGDASSWDGTSSNAVEITASAELRLNDNFYFQYFYINSSTNYPIVVHSVDAQYLSNLIIIGGGIKPYSAGNSYLNNIIIIDAPANGINNASDNWGNVYIFGLTVINAGTYGVYDHVAGWRNQGVRLYNSVIAGSGTADIEQDGQGTLQFCDYVATGDDSATNCGENTETYTDTGIVIADAFASTSTGLLKAGSDLIDAGNDYSASGALSEDIEGDTRSGTWDIGADEYVSATSRRIIFIQ